MSKKILYGTEAKEAIQRGVEKLADAVRITLGPKGKNVALKTEFNSPVIINDGVSIAKEIELEDEMENIGAEFIKRSCYEKQMMWQEMELQLLQF